MASTSSLGAIASTNSAEAQAFHERFQAQLRDVRQLLEAANGPDGLAQVMTAQAEARALLTEYTHQLPRHDQESHEQSLRRINEEVQAKRTSLAPKARFAFRRAAAAKEVDTGQDAKVGDVPIPSTTPAPVSTPYDAIEDRRGERIRWTSSSQTTLHLRRLQGCLVDLRSRTGATIQALQIRDLQSCIVLAGQIEGSVMVHNCQGCTLVLGCGQFRMHGCQDVAVALSTSSVATIEQCHAITFGPTNDVVLVPEISIGTSTSTPSHTSVRVQDFDHISTLTQSPHWRMADPKWTDQLQEALQKDDGQQSVQQILSHISVP